MESRKIGHYEVGVVGFGAAGLSVPVAGPIEESLPVLLAALDAGMTLIDTAACYVPSHLQPGHNEAVIAKALSEWGGDADSVLVATKGGLTRINDVDIATDFRADARPEAIRRDCDVSLRALGVERIGLYQLHAPDADVPLEETMGAFAELQQAGKVDLVGLSNVSLEQLDSIRQIVDVASVQNRFSPAHREHLDVVKGCAERGIAFLAYSPLGGLGQRARELPDVNPAFAEIAALRGVSPHQVALAWELTVSPTLIPIPGSRRMETALDSAAAAALRLTDNELALLGV